MRSIINATANIIAIDLGTRQDYTAIAVLRQYAVPTGDYVRRQVGFDLVQGAIYEPVLDGESCYDLIHLERWRGRGYRDVVPVAKQLIDAVRDDTHWRRVEAGMVNRPQLPTVVIVDATGVGVAVVEDLRANGLPCVGITITGGETVHRYGDDLSVPKRDLVSALMVVVENTRLTIADGLPLADVLIDELTNFAGTKTLTGRDSYGAAAPWREGNHDDCVLSVALGCWYGNAMNPLLAQRQIADVIATAMRVYGVR
jgi:hypothetical protein